MCSVYGGNVRRDMLDKYVCVSDDWLNGENDGSVNEKISQNGLCSVRKHLHERKEDLGLANEILLLPVFWCFYIITFEKVND